MPLVEVDQSGHAERAWVVEAIRRLKADQTRSADTHLHAVRMPAFDDVDLYLKDESTHPTGSLKHRLARSLFLYGLCSGLIQEGTHVVEASSGSTAVSEAFFAHLLGLPFTAVMARTTSPSKIALIEREGGSCVLVDDPASVYDVARGLAEESGGHYLDQFTYAERATDWRGNNNIAESIFDQLAMERFPDAARGWSSGAGTGGTSATIGRYVRYRGLATRLCVVDPENSAFLAAFRDPTLRGDDLRLAHRGHRPAARRAVLPARPGRPDGAGPRRRVGRRRALPARPHRPARRAVDGHRAVRRHQAGVRHAGRRGGRLDRHAAVRRRGPLPRHLLLRRPGSRRRAGTSRRTSPCSPAPGTTGSGPADRRLTASRSGIRDVAYGACR